MVRNRSVDGVTSAVGAAGIAAAAVAVGVGAVTMADVLRLWERVWPVLLFVVAMTVITELAAAAGVFTAVAGWATRWGRGSGLLLWLIVVVGAVVCTVFLSLDTTAVLLTPVVVGLARRARMDPLPFAVTTVWLANTGSLLLPVSNLTNLLAQQVAGGMSAVRFVALTAAPAAVAVAVPTLAVLLLMRRRIVVTYHAAAAAPASDPRLLRVAGVIVLVLLPMLVSGLPVWMPACAAAAVLAAVFAVRQPTVLHVRLVPWRLVLFATGLFLGVQVLHEIGLAQVVAAATGSGTGVADLLRLSLAGLIGANAVNNLPAYLALEPVAGHAVRLVALLVGVNAGALVAPWASLATLLWHGRLDALGVHVPWRTVVLWSAPVAVVTVGLASLTLWVTVG